MLYKMASAAIYDIGELPTLKEQGEEPIFQNAFHATNFPACLRTAMKKSSKLAVHKKGRMLLVRRRKDGKWTLPGGKRKKFEAPQRSLLRELKEELPYVEVKSVKRWGKSIRIEGENGKKKDHQIFTARKVRGRLTIGDREEIDRAGWFKPAKVKLTGVAKYARNRLVS